MIRESIAKLIGKKDLTEQESAETMREIMEGLATPSQISSFITALRMKGETVAEITGCAKTMRSKSLKINLNSSVSNEEVLIDTCGTGGDSSHTFNISTATAFVVSGCGIKVAKHGNHCVTSSCGSADVLSSLGVNINVTPEKTKQCIEEVGIGFLYAPLYHSAMKFASGPRKEIGIRTIFNILGPLTNPAGAQAQLLGVYDQNLTETLASVLKNLGSKSVLVVCGENGCDEVSVTGSTKISQLKHDGEIETYYINPEELGFKRASIEEIKGADASENSKIIIDIFSGSKGPKRDVILLNAGAALLAAGCAKDFKDGIGKAKHSVDKGYALNKLKELVEFTNK